MKYVFSAEQIKQCDDNMIKSGYTVEQLVKMAAKALSEEINKIEYSKALIIAGTGNNGNDGRQLAKLIKNCKVYSKIEDLSEEYDIVIDAIFGTGLSRNIEGEWKNIIEKVNKMNAIKIAVDIPSGLDSDTGSIMGCCVKADRTYTFVGYKYGQLLGNGRDMCGDIIVLDIGINNIISDCGYVTEGEEVQDFFCKRSINTHKGSYGKTAIYAGSDKYFGAGVLSCSAEIALKIGVGYCYLLTHKRLISDYRNTIPEAIILPESSPIPNIDSVAVGMGLGNGRRVAKIINSLTRYSGRLIIDADALNYISNSRKDVLMSMKAQCVLTPHLVEFSRLINVPVWKIEQMPVEYAKQYAKEKNIVLMLKGSTTIITDGKRVCLNIFGSPALAKAGSGDVLSGVLSALLARGKDVFKSVIASDIIFKKASENAAKRLGEYSVLARDVIEEINKINMQKHV